jgi:hypothetical protein
LAAATKEKFLLDTVMGIGDTFFQLPLQVNS